MTQDEKAERLKINGSIRKVSPSCHCASLALLFLDVLKMKHDAKEKTLNKRNKYLKSGLVYVKREESI